jgi:hypothetical protein
VLNTPSIKLVTAFTALFTFTLPDAGVNSCILDSGYGEFSHNLRLTIKNSISILSISTPNCLAKKY